MGLSRNLTRVLSFPLARDLIPAPEWVTPWTPPTDTYPTAFSPTQRGGVAGAYFGVYATGGMRTVVYDPTYPSNQWRSIRAISGIADGEECEWRVVIEGATTEQGIAIGNASADLQSYVGNDANGFVYFGHVGEIYHNGSSVHTVATFAAGDVIHVAVSRVSDEMWIYKQTGGVGAFTEYGPYDISALGAGTWYPIHALYNSSGQSTYDFGHTEFTSQSGFPRGPVGNWGWWNDPAIVAAMTDTWLASDTTRMWEAAASAGTSAPDVVNNDPLGGWYGILYARLLEQSTAAQRPTYTTAGVRFNATGGTKQMADALASTFNANTPFTVLLNFDLLSGRSIRAGLGTSATALNSGVSWGTGGKEVVTTRVTATSLATADVRNDACIVLTYDGTKAYALDSDGTWGEVPVGTSTGTITHLVLRAVNAESTNATVYAYQILSGAVNEYQAKNLQWSARNVL